MIESLIAFLSMFFVDVLYSVYIKYVTDKKEVHSGIFSGIIYLANAAATISVVENHWILIPAVLGAALGTYVGVLINKKLPS